MADDSGWNYHFAPYAPLMVTVGAADVVGGASVMVPKPPIIARLGGEAPRTNSR